MNNLELMNNFIQLIQMCPRQLTHHEPLHLKKMAQVATLEQHCFMVVCCTTSPPAQSLKSKSYLPKSLFIIFYFLF